MQVYTQVNNDPPIEQDIISTVVTLHENGLPICHLIANNYKGKLYLQTLKLFSTVTVKFAYEDNGTINWDNIEPVFKGKIVEIGPEMNSRGETLVATAICGELLKQARVNKEYLAGLKEETDITGSYDVNGWIPGKSEWAHVNNVPWLHFGDDDFIAELARVRDEIDISGRYYVDERVDRINDFIRVNSYPWLKQGYGDYISIPADHEYVGYADGDYKFSDVTLRSNTYINKFELHIVGRLVDGSNGHCNNASFSISIYDGHKWHYYNKAIKFESTSWTDKTINLMSNINISDVNNLRFYITFSELRGGGPTKGEIWIAEAYLYIEGITWDNINLEDGDYIVKQIPDCEEYIVNKLILCVRGRMTRSDVQATVRIKAYEGHKWCTYVDFTFNETNWTTKSVNVMGSAISIGNFNNMKIAVILHDSSNNTASAAIHISAVWFEIEGIGRNYYHNTLRNIIQDVKNDCLDKLLGEQVAQPEDYKIKIDYVYGWEEDYPYMNFPFTDGLYCINELVKIGCSMNYVKEGVNYRGLHWIVTPNNQLVIAPVGNHGVYGANGSCYIENVWETYCPLNPIIVKEDMIQAQFKTEIPLANTILVAGKFVYPKDDMWTEMLYGWDYAWKHTGGFGLPTVNLMLNNSVAIKGKCSLHFRISLGWDHRVVAILYRPLVINFSKLVSKNTNAYINLQIYGGMKGLEIKLRLYDAFELIPGKGDYTLRGSYYEHDLSQHLPVNGGNKWRKIEIPITYNDLTDTDKEGVWTVHADSGFEHPSWDRVKWIVIYILTDRCINPLGVTDDWLFDDICVVGNIVRGAYTSDCGYSNIDDCKIGCIKHYGVRTYTIKDSLAQTDSLDPDNDDNTLAQVALYELLRHRVPRTTATIQVPLYPSIKAGQIVHIKYNQLEDGSYLIDREFRITKVTHQFSSEGAKTILEITDDVRNSLPINTSDPFTVLLRAVNPDTQTKTFASLKHEGTFVTGINILWKQYNQ